MKFHQIAFDALASIINALPISVGENRFIINHYYIYCVSHKEEKNKTKESSGLCPTLLRHSDIRYLLLFGGNLPAVLWRAYVSNRKHTRALELFLLVDNNNWI